MAIPATPAQARAPAGAGEPPSPRARRRLLNRGNLRDLLILSGILLGRPTAASLAAGSLLLLPGLALHIWAKGCLRQNREVCTGGPYRLTRNPFYLANLLIDASLAVVANRVLLLAAYLGIWLLVYGRRIRAEETTLDGLFGERYREYRALVPRLLPLARPLPRRLAAPAFSFGNPNLSKGREYARVASLLSIPLVLFLAREAIRTRGSSLAHPGPAALAGLSATASLQALSWGLKRRLRRQRRLFPRFLHHPLVRAEILLLAGSLSIAEQRLATESPIVVLGLGGFLAGAAAALAALLLASRAAASGARVRAWEALVGAAFCCLSGNPWLGALVVGLFALLAVDAAGEPAAAPAGGDDATGREPLEALPGALGAFVAGLALFAELAEHPLWR